MLVSKRAWHCFAVSRKSHYTLTNGKSPSRQSEVEETDFEVCVALHGKFGSDVVSVDIEGRIYQLDDESMRQMTLDNRKK